MSVKELERGRTIMENRYRWFLIYQTIITTTVFLLCKLFFLSPFIHRSPIPSNDCFCPYFMFLIFLLLFSLNVVCIASTQPDRPALPSEILYNLSVFLPEGQPKSPDFRRRVRISLTIVFFVTLSAILAWFSVSCVSWSSYSFPEEKLIHSMLGTLGFRSFAVGFIYGLHYVYNRRWILQFPNDELHPFFRFRMRIPLAIGQALKLSSIGYLISGVLGTLLPSDIEYGSQVTFADHIVFYIGVFVVFLCWELTHHLYQVLHTTRLIFAPSKGSAAAETSPSEPLLSVLEESEPKSLLQYFAYHDLHMVCENNFDAWRRAAFFEETGETYKQVVAVCLRPLEQLTVKLAEGLESCAPENSFPFSHQLRSPTERLADSRLNEILNDFQICAWSAQSAASLIFHSLKEDQFGVARHSVSNAAIMSTLLSTLLTVETIFMGKKTNLQSPRHVLVPAGIKWAALNNGRRDSVVGERKDSVMYSKAYNMAKILRTSIYCISLCLHPTTKS